MKYIDLGLPSGTLWSDTNEEGFYTFDEAVEKYGDRLPSREQFEELKSQCQWEWMGGGYKVTGHNGNCIVLPSAGYRNTKGDVLLVDYDGYYWSSTPHDLDYACNLDFYSCSVGVYNSYQGNGFSVRLVK